MLQAPYAPLGVFLAPAASPAPASAELLAAADSVEVRVRSLAYARRLFANLA
jgi:hypothetical protein